MVPALLRQLPLAFPEGRGFRKMARKSIVFAVRSFICRFQPISHSNRTFSNNIVCVFVEWLLDVDLCRAVAQSVVESPKQKLEQVVDLVASLVRFLAGPGREVGALFLFSGQCQVT